MVEKKDKLKKNNKLKIENILADVIKKEKFSKEGTLTKKIDSFSSLTEANHSDVSFCSYSMVKGVKNISESKAGIIICSTDMKGCVHPREGSQLIFVENPKLTFIQFLKKIKMLEEIKSGKQISSLAVIAKSAKIGKNCYIGNFVTIGKNCVIGDNTIIHDRTIIQNCKIGKNCTIQSGVTLGEDGFSYDRYENGKVEKFPHFRGIIIGDFVEINSNSNIARGSLNDTIIGNGTKIDSLVHIAHNARIGKNCLIVAGSIIGGSSTIGDSCWCGLNCTIKNGVKIGNNVLVGAGACVIRNVPNSDVVAGVPAKSIKEKTSSGDLYLMSGQKKSN